MDIRLPKLGEGAESGTVVNILVKEGDTISAGQTIVELENEKAVAPIPTTASGVVTQLRVKVGDKISAGQVILTLNSTGAAAATAAVPATQPAAVARGGVVAPRLALPVAPAVQPVTLEAGELEPMAEGEMPAASPSIRRMARDLGIDLRRVRGSERGGRIVISDLRAYIEELQRVAFAPKPAGAAVPGAPSAPVAESTDFSRWGPVTKQPLSGLRQTIGRRLLESWHRVPRVTQFDEADVTGLNELRKRHAPAYEQKGAKLTLTPLILKAVVAVLKRHRIFNCSLDEATQGLVFKDYYHIGLAVDTEQGLLVPVIRDVDKKGVLELSREVVDLAEKARQRKLSLEEMKGGTFTISNQGGIGGGHFTPIVNQPEVAILGLGRSQMKAVVRDGKIEARLMLPLAISYDHRVIDGGSAARFAVDLVQALEGFAEVEVKI